MGVAVAQNRFYKDHIGQIGINLNRQNVTFFVKFKVCHGGEQVLANPRKLHSRLNVCFVGKGVAVL